MPDFIQDTEALISNLSQRSGKEISEKALLTQARAWVKNYSHTLDTVFSGPNDLDKLHYIGRTVHNQRLDKSSWLKKLKALKKKMEILEQTKESSLGIWSFDPNKPFTAYQTLREFFANAQNRVLIYDGYVEEKTLEILGSLPKSASIRILTNNTYGNFTRELRLFEKEHSIEVKKLSTVHDRFFIIDGKCYLSGTSLHSLGGQKSSTLCSVDSHIMQIFEKRFEQDWAPATKV